MNTSQTPRIAIACGGTGGHLFPGIAIADQLVRRGGAVTLLISSKEVDQEAVKTISGMEVLTLPAVGLTRGRILGFVRGFVRSYRMARRYFEAHRPCAALAMGGFTSAPPILAAKKLGARTFLHESNTIPGRANRWLSRVVDQAFVGFPQAGSGLRNRKVTVTGTPVRAQFHPRDAAECRAALGLDPARPVLLVMGGSQGAHGINELIAGALPLLAGSMPQLQLFHLAGTADVEPVRNACASLSFKAAVHPFFARMELALGAASVAVSRAGASSLAELAAAQVPAILVPFPAATDNHQFYNALAFAETGAARLMPQKGATPGMLARLILDLLGDAGERAKMQAALARWHSPAAAERIAERILETVSCRADGTLPQTSMAGSCGNSRPPVRGIERRDLSAA